MEEEIKCPKFQRARPSLLYYSTSKKNIYIYCRKNEKNMYTPQLRIEKKVFFFFRVSGSLGT